MRSLAVVGLLVGVLLINAPAPSDTDERFLAALDSHGIHYTSSERAVASGHQVCWLLQQGQPITAVAQAVMNNSSLDGYHAGFFVGVSITSYCPEQRP